MKESMLKQSYDDWVALLMRTNNEDMLANSYDVWVEAFHAGAMLIKHKCLHAVMTELQLGMSEDFDNDASINVTEVKQLQASMLKKVVDTINAQQA